jgi:N-acetylglucosaminyl-diphospho-decaprenol L-rhamnosyltransferase
VTTPRVSVIVLNYNGRQWLGGCLEALAAQQGAPPFDVLVADNASTDDSIRFLTERFPDVRVVQNRSNLGFAAGNNAGATRATGDWLVFLNNDTVPAADWLSHLCRPLVERPEIAVVTSRIVFLDDPSILDSAGDGYLRAGGAYKHGHRTAAAAHMQSGEVFGACGAAFVIRRDVFEALGGFDERFFMVYEDVDLSYRLRLAGYRCWYAADAVVRHAGSGTLGRMSGEAVFFGQRNLEWTWIKNTPWPLLVRTAGSHVVYSAAGLAYYLRAGRFGPALRGKLAAIGGIPEMLRARRRMRPLRRTGWRAIERWLDQGWMRVKRGEKPRRT